MGSPLLYEINTRCWLADLSDQFAHPITLGNVPDAVLEAWRQFGFSYVWLMGVWATGPKSRSIALQQPWIQEYGKLLPGFTEQDVGASPYAISSYAVDPAVGGDAELREFRRRLNAAGLKLVLDFIPNHTGLDHPWLTTRPELYVQSEGGFETPGLKQLRIAHGKDPYFPAWTDTAQLDYRSAETHAVMSDELASVAARCDGVRCDMAMLVLRDVFAKTWRGTETKHPLARAEFWPAAIARCKSQFPEFVFIAEVYWGLEERLVGMGFDYAYDKTLYDAVLRNDPGGVREHIYSTARHRLARSVHFLENHDEPRIASLLGLQQHRAAAILILGLPGMRLIHEGQLTGRRVRLPVQLRRRPPEPEDPQIAAMYAELLKISSKSAVGRGDWSLFESQPSTIDKEIRIRWSGEERVDIVSVDLSSLSACIISGSEENSSRAGFDPGGVIRQYGPILMSDLLEKSEAQAPASSSQEELKPAAKPSQSAFKLLRDVLNHGGPGYLQFAITNICNAKCDFCGFAVDRFDPAKRRSVTLQQARDVIDICVKNHIGYLLFVGGEPLVHKDLRAMTRYAAERGIRPMICTNGSLWTDRNMRELASDGLSSVIMSIDAHDAIRHEKNRGLPDVCRKIKHANAVFEQLGVQTTASITASKLIEDYGKLPPFLTELGFKTCTFSYPLTNLASSYLSFSDSSLVNYRTEELVEVFEKIKRMKRESGFPVVNPAESLNEMQRHLRGEREKFGCLGGHKYFYLDWNLQLYRCHFWEKPMCSIYEFDDSKLIRDGCTRCMIDCYRDPSVLQFVAISASDAWKNLKRGNLAGACKNIFDSRNITSIKAVWEDRKYIGGV